MRAAGRATDGTDGKRRAVGFGRWAEWLAAWALRLRGYRIIGRQVRTRAGEIDIVARRGPVVAFVEVKARGDLEAAAHALRPKQAARIVRASEAFIQAHPAYGGCDRRFDVILVRPWRLPRHLADAWRP